MKTIWIHTFAQAFAAARGAMSKKSVGRPARAGHHLLAAALASALALTGCSHLGPRTVTVDRFEYSAAIAESWKQQTLLNIVKLRYMDLPVFVDVASIVSGYSMQTGVSVNGTVSSQTAIQGNFVAGSGQAIYTDRPTITYVPLTGEKFLRGMMTPIDPKNIFFMIQAGYAADFVLGLTVESLNGVRNRATASGAMREADPDFVRALELLREIQATGAFGMRVKEDKIKSSTAVLFFRREDVPAEVVEKTAEIRRLLKLPVEQQQFTITYSPVRGADNELAVNSRSLMQIMAAFATYLDAPEAHLRDHSAVPAFENSAQEKRGTAVRIHSGRQKPTNTFAAAHYRDHWFWIEEGDWQTKRALVAVMFFFTLAETGEEAKLPLVTIPAQ